jgi:hypothetical protein
MELLLAVSAALTLVTPAPDAIVYGPTSIEVRGPEGWRYEVAVERGPGAFELVCRSDGPPPVGTCSFDAWTDFSAETIRVLTRGNDGQIGQQLQVTTREFSEPDADVAALRPIEVEAALIGDESWGRALIDNPASIGCELAGKPCRVRHAESRSLRGTLHLAVLIDESGSMREPAANFVTALESLQQRLVAASDPREGFQVVFRVSAFSGVRRELMPDFSASIAELSAALRRLNPEGSTSLWTALREELSDLARRRELDRLAGRKSQYVLVVVSDGVDTAGSEASLGFVSSIVASAGVPILNLVLPAAGTEQAYRSLGWLSGGRTFLQTAIPSKLIAGPIYEFLRARALLTLEADPAVDFKRERTLRLLAPAGGELLHPDRVRPAKTSLEIAVELLADLDSSAALRLEALERVAADGRGVELARVVLTTHGAWSKEQRRRQRWDLQLAWPREQLRTVEQAWHGAMANLAGRTLLWRRNSPGDRREMLQLLRDAEELGLTVERSSELHAILSSWRRLFAATDRRLMYP